MTCEEIVDQALAMLRRRGRVTYRALQLQFKLGDATLEALKEELLFSQSQVVDEDGRGLSWVGGAQPPTLQETPAPVAASPPEPPAPEAERRQLTVMFCDLVDSTRLSGQLDPEDYRELVRAYQAASAEVIRRFEGHIAQYLGDGLLVYVGYPQAHEDDAQRAVHAGLKMVEAISTLNAQLERDKGVRLAVRVGIHTGMVVVGEVGSGGRQEQLALGETPNIAASIQGHTPDVKLAKVEQALHQSHLPLAETVPLLAALLSLPLPENRYPPRTLSPQRQRQKTVEEMTKAVLESGILQATDGRYEPGPPPVATSGQDGSSPTVAGPNLRLVHRRV
jgi:class 3 adenylate cyclase